MHGDIKILYTASKSAKWNKKTRRQEDIKIS